MLEQDRKQMLAEIGLFCVAAGVGAFVWAFQTGESPTGRYGEAESAGCVLAQLVLTGVCFFWINKVGKVGGDQPAWEQALASARVNYMIPLACYSGFLGGYWATSVGVGTLIGSVVALFLTGLLWRAFDDSKARRGWLPTRGWMDLAVGPIDSRIGHLGASCRVDLPEPRAGLAGFVFEN
jgi:MFS family permease